GAAQSDVVELQSCDADEKNDRELRPVPGVEKDGREVAPALLLREQDRQGEKERQLREREEIHRGQRSRCKRGEGLLNRNQNRRHNRVDGAQTVVDPPFPPRLHLKPPDPAPFAERLSVVSDAAPDGACVWIAREPFLLIDTAWNGQSRRDRGHVVDALPGKRGMRTNRDAPPRAGEVLSERRRRGRQQQGDRE